MVENEVQHSSTRAAVPELPDFINLLLGLDRFELFPYRVMCKLLRKWSFGGWIGLHKDNIGINGQDLPQ
ncbi:hypothetical protein [Chroococcidiopsis sp. CCMEE 29]|uniref:hypothetical protein n=1 Tax=Chroococcidiopsis sp. CCMEE 29 TaxID=155894 RepID=UPI002022256C|nr:hypothetical protein [Chroococcidiopsis sp. CCMEE 29]